MKVGLVIAAKGGWLQKMRYSLLCDWVSSARKHVALRLYWLIMESSTLSRFEEETLWQNMLGAETRADYFAELSSRYRRFQFRISLGVLVLSSGAFFSLVTSIIPPSLQWIKPFLAFCTAFLSAWSLLARNENKANETADLHLRWQNLALDYKHVWCDVTQENAGDRLREIEKQEAALSKSGTSFPNDKKLLALCQDNVAMHHGQEVTA